MGKYFIVIFLTIKLAAQTGNTYSNVVVQGLQKSDICTKEAVFPFQQDYIRLNVPYNYTSDTSEFNKLSSVYPSLRNLYIYQATFGKYPDVLLNNSVHNIYNYNSSYTGFPNAYSGSQVRQLLFDGSLNIPSVLPTNWVNMKYVNYIYLRSNKYTTAQVNALINQIEGFANSGMGINSGGIHYVYFNGTGTFQNGVPTISTFISNGWVQTGTGQNSYISKTILGNEWRIFYNP